MGCGVTKVNKVGNGYEGNAFVNEFYPIVNRYMPHWCMDVSLLLVHGCVTLYTIKRLMEDALKFKKAFCM